MTHEAIIFPIPPANDANEREYSGMCRKDTSMTIQVEAAKAFCIPTI